MALRDFRDSHFITINWLKVADTNEIEEYSPIKKVTQFSLLTPQLVKVFESFIDKTLHRQDLAGR